MKTGSENTEALDFLDHQGMVRDTKDVILDRNFQQLEKIIEKHQELYASHGTEERRKAFALAREFRRLFHNYIVSYYTLKKQTEKLIENKIEDKHLDKEEVLEKMEETGLKDREDFIVKLRHYTQKYKLSEVSNVEVFGETRNGIGSGQYFGIDKQSFVEWCEKGNNRQKAKEYVEETEDIIYIGEEVKQFQECVDEYFEWLIPRVREIYKQHYRND